MQQRNAKKNPQNNSFEIQQTKSVHFETKSKFTSCLPMVGGSHRVLQLLPPLKLVAMILLKVALSTIKQIKSNILKKRKPMPF
jgi:hypothetical protein